jgi:hypothetical protein
MKNKIPVGLGCNARCDSNGQLHSFGCKNIRTTPHTESLDWENDLRKKWNKLGLTNSDLIADWWITRINTLLIELENEV